MDGNEHFMEYVRKRILHFTGNILFRSDVGFHFYLILVHNRSEGYRVYF